MMRLEGLQRKVIKDKKNCLGRYEKPAYLKLVFPATTAGRTLSVLILTTVIAFNHALRVCLGNETWLNGDTWINYA